MGKAQPGACAWMRSWKAVSSPGCCERGGKQLAAVAGGGKASGAARFCRTVACGGRLGHGAAGGGAAAAISTPASGLSCCSGSGGSSLLPSPCSPTPPGGRQALRPCPPPIRSGRCCGCWWLRSARGPIGWRRWWRGCGRGGNRGPSVWRPVSHPLNAYSRTDGLGQRVYLWIRGHDPEDPTQLRQPAQGPSARGALLLGSCVAPGRAGPASAESWRKAGREPRPAEA